MADPAPPDAEELQRYVDEAAARATGAEPAYAGRSAEPAAATVEQVLHHLHEAWAVSGAGTDLPADARMRQVKRAILMAMRPVTSHQVPFNRELAVAVKELAGGLAAIGARVDDVDRTVDTASARLQANLATTELTVDDLADDVGRLTEAVDELLTRTKRLEEELVDERATVSALRRRQDLVLRKARSAIDAAATEAEEAEAEGPSAEVDPAGLVGEDARRVDGLGEDLIGLVRGTRDEVRAEVEMFIADVIATGAAGPVIDLGCGRGEWLEALRDRGVEAYGVDTSQWHVSAAGERGLDVRLAEATAHLSTLSESSIGAISAFHLVDRLGTDSLVDLIDGALAALRPGGILILATPNPTSLEVGAADFWLDPARRRPVHPRLLEFLVLSRGFAEAELRWMRPADPTTLIRPDDLGGADDGRRRSVVERLNRALAGPRDYAVVARKSGPSPVANA